MANLKTTYLGIEIDNPIVIGSSTLTADLDSAKKMEDAGAGAIITKSLFEEQIHLENFDLEEDLQAYNDRNPEMISLFPNLKHAGPEEHLNKLRKIKQALSIPVIASLNAVYKESWIEYAKLIEETGVDALELNFYHHPKNPEIESKEIIDEQLEILYKIKSKANIPVSIKLSPYYTNPLRAIHRMNKVGLDGFVLFNRLFQPDIDIEKEELTKTFNYSNPDDYKISLRFAGLLYKEIKSDIIGATGIFKGEDVIKMILAGANAVQIVSTVYKNTPDIIGKMKQDIAEWMDKKSYSSLNDFKGKLAKINIKNDPFAYKRANYVSILMEAANVLAKRGHI